MLMYILTILLAAINLHIDDPSTWTASDLKSYIGQTVVFDVPIYVCGHDEYGDGLQVSPSRRFSPTNQAYPMSAEYNALVSRGVRGCFYLTDYPAGTPMRRTGEKVYQLTAYVKDDTHLQWKSGTWATENRREDLEKGFKMSDIDMRGEHTLLVCAMNCEYYLTSSFGTGGTMGPNSEAAHQKQRTKVCSALAKINADIYGLVEVQQGDGAISEIASELNKRHTDRSYTIIRTGTVASGTYTQSAFIYDSKVVTPVGAMVKIDDGVKDRKRMQLFEEIATGEQFIYSINHFKAKSSGGSGNDADLHDGQGGYNEARTKEAMAVMKKYNVFSQQVHDEDLLIMGDLNAYAKEDPITVFLRRGMYDLHREFHADSSYSYQFYDNTVGYLDHAISSISLYRQITGMTAYHINSDESDRYTYDKSNDQTMFRCSDHDPIIVGLRLDKTRSNVPTMDVNTWNILHEGADIVITNAIGEKAAAYYTLLRADGIVLQQGEITEKEQSIPKPAVSGLYILTIYDGKGTINQKKLWVNK